MEPVADRLDAPESPSVLGTVACIVGALVCSAIGNGLMFAFIPVRLGNAGYDPTWAGSILTGIALGCIAACFLTGWLTARIGHVGAFATFSALIVLSNLIIAWWVEPVVWIGARALYGLAIAGAFIVAQSWLNEITDNSMRGRVMAIFYVCYVVGLGMGSFLMGFVDISSAQAPLIGALFAAVSAVPIAVARARPEQSTASVTIAFSRIWAISPVGVAGMLAVGGLSMMIAGFAPIHATASGYSQTQVATLLLAIPLGTLLVQLPFGWISDRTDRRYVLMAASLLVVVSGVAAGVLDGLALLVLIPVYMIWSGAAESIYSLSLAHANDRAGKEDMLVLSSTMTFIWSLSGFLVPAAVTALTAFYGTQAFMFAAIAIATAFGAFVLVRILSSPAVASEETGAFTPVAAHLPPPVEMPQTPPGSGDTAT